MKTKRHLELNLGKACLLSSTKDDKGQKMPFQIATFSNQPSLGATTCSTIGMSDTPFKQEDGSHVRHELFFCAHEQYINDEIYKILFSVGKELIQKKRSIKLGMLFEPKTQISKDFNLEIFWFFNPVYFPDRVHILETVEPAVHFAWMIPIYRTEANYIIQEGAQKFDELLLNKNPNLLDFQRDSIISY